MRSSTFWADESILWVCWQRLLQALSSSTCGWLNQLSFQRHVLASRSMLDISWSITSFHYSFSSVSHIHLQFIALPPSYPRTATTPFVSFSPEHQTNSPDGISSVEISRRPGRSDGKLDCKVYQRCCFCVCLMFLPSSYAIQRYNRALVNQAFHQSFSHTCMFVMNQFDFRVSNVTLSCWTCLHMINSEKISCLWVWCTNLSYLQFDLVWRCRHLCCSSFRWSYPILILSFAISLSFLLTFLWARSGNGSLWHHQATFGQELSMPNKASGFVEDSRRSSQDFGILNYSCCHVASALVRISWVVLGSHLWKAACLFHAPHVYFACCFESLFHTCVSALSESSALPLLL